MKFLNHNLFTGDITVNGTTTLSTATGVTRTTGDNTTHLATTAFVKAQDYATNTALGNYVPLSRTLTINNVTYDLSADRSWTIGTSDYTSVVKHVVKAGVAITKGQAIYVTSADGTNMIVGLASNATEPTSSKTMGLAETTVAINGFTNVVTEGLLAGLNTVGANAGDPVWLGTGGNLIYGLLNKPYAPAHLVFIGIVTRVNANNGEIFVKVQNGFELKEIHDVDLITTAPINGHLLGYNGTLWVNKTIAGWLGYTPANASGTTNYVSKFTGTTTLGNSQIFDNGTNVGIGTASPAEKLAVAGNIRSAGNVIASVGLGYGNYISMRHDDTNGYITITRTVNAGHLILEPYGNVGIGTSVPANKLVVTSDASPTSENSYAIAAASASDPAYKTVIGYDFTNDIGLIAAVRTGIGWRNISIPQGNLGIGTTSPNAKLEVDGSFNVKNGDGNISHLNYGDTSINYFRGVTYFDTNSAYFTGGNVGIGTAAPQKPLEVISAANDFVSIGVNQIGAGNWTGIHFGYRESNTSYRKSAIVFERTDLTSNNAQGKVHILNGPQAGAGSATLADSKLTIAENGNVGIGTTSPANKLQVANGDMSITSGYSFILADTDTNWRLGRNIISPVESVYLNSSTFEFVAANASDQGWQFINDDGYPVLEIGAATGSRNVWVNAGNLLVPTGNVGIGTTSPISGQGTPLTLASSTGYVGLTLSGSGAYAHTWQLYASGDGGSNKFFGIYDSTNAAYRLVVTSGGNVGIGTSSPTEKLHVDGRARITTIDNGTGDFATISGTGVITRRTAAQVLSDIGAQPSGSYLTAESDTLQSVTSRGSSTNTDIRIKRPSNKVDNASCTELPSRVEFNNAFVAGSAGYTVFTYPTSSVFRIYGDYDGYVGGVQPDIQLGLGYLTVKSAGGTIGNVGIGTTAPTFKLDVNGTFHSGGDATFNGTNTYINSSYIYVGNNASDLVSISGNTMYLPGDGNVGIGTTDPTSQMSGTSGIGIYNALYPAVGFKNSTTAWLWYGQGSTFKMWNVTAGDILTANTSGNIGIGTISPSTKLDVNGVITATGGNSTLWNTAYGWGNHASAGYLTSYTETDTLATVTARGSSTNSSIFINGVFTGGLGAVTTSGTLDWNDVSNARAGQGYTLLLGTATNGMGSGQYYHPVSFEYSSKNGGGNMTQLAIPYTGNGIWYRNRYGGSWSSWARVWDDSSFTSTNISNWNTAYGWGNHASQGYATQTYVNTAIANLVDSAPSTLDTLNELAAALGDDPNFATTVTNSIAAKLPLAGGTMSGTISFINDIGTALQGTVGINDYWRIYANSTTTNAGYLEIATSDDGTEPIYVRQYTGVFSSLTRTATLLDGSGNTSLPGSLTVGGTITENSSIRYKENVVDLESATEKVEQLRAVRYNKIGHEIEEIGLIAEEVAEVYPEVVNYNEEGQPDGVNYTRLSVILLKALQEQNAVIASLSERINKLESK